MSYGPLQRIRLALFTLLCACSYGVESKELGQEIHGQLSQSGLPAALQQVYAQQRFATLWHSPSRHSEEADALVEWAGDLPQRYLLTADPPSNLLQQPRFESYSMQALAQHDIALTQELFWLAQGIFSGRGSPANDPKWAYPRRELAADIFAAQWQKRGMMKTLRQAMPQSHAFKLLHRALAELLDQTHANWQPIEIPMPIALGQSHAHVSHLRQKLIQAGYLQSSQTAAKNTVFDHALHQALLHFQADHNLETDGQPGPLTLAVLNISPQRLRDTVALNLQRYHWMPHDLPARRIEVNLPNFRLTAYNNHQAELSMKVVIGKDEERTQTRAFTANMSYLVVNPYWNIPKGITHREVLPAIRKDPSYLSRNNMEVVRGWGVNAPPLAPEELDWDRIAVHGGEGPVLRIRQKPGYSNALGRIKFMLPNKYNLYLHDTPAKSLFSRSRRTFSHGCMRLQKPQQLARWILQNQAGWTPKRLKQAIDSGQRTQIDLSQTVPVYVTYFTAQVEDGNLKLWPDIYGRDALFLDDEKQRELISAFH